MTKRLLLGILLVLLVASTAPAIAHDKYRFIGTVAKMDGPKKLLTIKTNDKKLPPEVDIDITAKTRIERDGKKVTSAALKPGVYVVIDALGDDVFGTEAVSVRIVPAPAK
jgi:hypothetical protein